jgi:hypothetical protein
MAVIESVSFAVGRRASAAGSAAPATAQATAALRDGDCARARARFSRAEIIALVQAWQCRYGEPPTIRDWDPSRARRTGQAWRAERFAAGDWPSVGMVKRQFGTFNAAVRDAGLTARQGPCRSKAHLSGSAQVLAAIVAWTKRYGDPPTQADWDPVRARRLHQPWRIVRYRCGDWPSLNTVLYHYGSLGEAVRAAGLTPRAAGDHGETGPRRRVGNLRAVAEIGADAGPRASASALAAHVEAVARARAVADPQQLRMALLDVASSAIRWATDIAWAAE